MFMLDFIFSCFPQRVSLQNSNFLQERKQLFQTDVPATDGPKPPYSEKITRVSLKRGVVGVLHVADVYWDILSCVGQKGNVA